MHCRKLLTNHRPVVDERKKELLISRCCLQIAGNWLVLKKMNDTDAASFIYSSSV